MLHGHGAKGAALARLTPSAPQAIRVYTPHGGSLVYSPGTLRGGFYRKLEWLLIGRTDLFLFESSYAADLFRSKIGRPRAMVRVVRNGVGDAEFAPITARPDATDIVSVGELRPVKAIDVLVEALAVLKRSGRPVTATIAGEGPQGADLKAQAERLGIADLVRFVGYRPAREAFAMGRMLVIPSRAESLPYIVLEAAAAGMPIIATKVGGNPEIFGAQADHLITPDDSAALVSAIAAALGDPHEVQRVTHAVRTPGAQRVLLDRDGRKRSCRLPRNHRHAKTRAIRVTDFCRFFTILGPSLPTGAYRPVCGRTMRDDHVQGRARRDLRHGRRGLFSRDDDAARRRATRC